MRLYSFFLAIVMFLVVGPAYAGSWRVEQDGSGDFLTLQPAVDVAASGDTIFIGPGLYQDFVTVINEAGYEIQVIAYLNDARDLVFIGEGSELVSFGPDVYSPNNESGSPAGVYSEIPSTVEIAGIFFRNLHWPIANIGAVYARGCAFTTGSDGVYSMYGGGGIDNCIFTNFDNAVFFADCDTVTVENCTLNNSRIYFGQTIYGEIRDCVVNGGGFGYYYQSGGLVAGNTINCADVPCLDCSYSLVTVNNNSFTGGSAILYINGAGAEVEAWGNMFSNPEYWHFHMQAYGSLRAWNNDIYRETLGPQFFLKAYYYSNPSDAYIDVRNNHWGLSSSESQLALRIWDGSDDPDLKIFVDYIPFSTEPLETKNETIGGFKSMFRDATR